MTALQKGASTFSQALSSGLSQWPECSAWWQPCSSMTTMGSSMMTMGYSMTWTTWTTWRIVMKLSSKMLDGRYLTKEAAKAGLVTRKGKGDHFIIEAPTGRGYMTCPQREIGRGLASEIVK